MADFDKQNKTIEQIKAEIASLTPEERAEKLKAMREKQAKIKVDVYGDGSEEKVVVDKPVFNLKQYLIANGIEYSYYDNVGELDAKEYKSIFRETNNLKEAQVFNGDVSFKSDSKDFKMPKLELIKGNANFAYCKNIEVPILQKIVGNASFDSATKVEAPFLQRIYGDAGFSYCYNSNFEKLETINGNANFSNIKNLNLHSLATVGGNANFENSVIEDLSSLEVVKGNANFHLCGSLRELPKLRKVDGELNIDAFMVKEYPSLESCGEIVLDYGVIPQFPKLVKCGRITIKGPNGKIFNIDLQSFKKVSKFLSAQNFVENTYNIADNNGWKPEDVMFVNYDANFTGCDKLELNVIGVGGLANFANCKTKRLPYLKQVGSINLNGSSVEEMLNLTEVNVGFANFRDSKVKSLPKLEYVKGRATFTHSSIQDLSSLTQVDGVADFSYCKNLKTLPKLEIGSSDVNFAFSGIENVALKRVFGSLDLRGCKNLKSLPKLEYVGIGIKLTIDCLPSLPKIKADLTPYMVEIYDESGKNLINTLTIKEYAKFRTSYDNKAFVETFNVDENVGGVDFARLTTVKGDIDFAGAKTELPNLQTVFANADFSESKIKGLPSLVSVVGDLDVSFSSIQNMDNLKQVDSTLYMVESKVKSLPKLEKASSIMFSCGAIPKVDNLKECEKIAIVDANNPAVKVLFTFESFRSLENELRACKTFAEVKKLKTKSPDTQKKKQLNKIKMQRIIECGKIEQIEGDLVGDSTKINYANLKTITGNAIFDKNKYQTLPALKEIGGNAEFKFSEIKELPSLEKIGGDANFDTSYTSMQKLKTVGGKLNLTDYQVGGNCLPELEEVGGNFKVGYLITDLPSLKVVKGKLNAYGSQLETLPNLTEVGGDADFRGSNIQYLPELTKVNGVIFLEEYAIEMPKLKQCTRVEVWSKGKCSYRFLTLKEYKEFFEFVKSYNEQEQGR